MQWTRASPNQLHDTTSLLDLAFGVFAEVPRADDEWNLRYAALAEDLAVAEWEEVEDGCGVCLAAGEVLLALFLWHERPELHGTMTSAHHIFCTLLPSWSVLGVPYLVEVDDGLPEPILHLVEVSHANFSEVARMVLVEVRTMVMLATRHPAATGVLSVLADSSMTGGDVAAAGRDVLAFGS